jgi:toxin YoeB
MSRRIAFTDHAWSDYLAWQQADRKMLRRINALINAAAHEPFEGVGKPEPLRGDWQGFWSRRIDDMHRLVYEADAHDLVIATCRYHYGDH